MYAMIIALAALCLLPIGLYFYHYLRRMAGCFGWETGRKSVKIAAGLLSTGIALLAFRIWDLSALIVLHVFAFAMVMELLHWLAQKCRKGRLSKRWETLYRCGIVPLGCTALLLAYGVWNMGHVVQTDYTVYTDKDIRAEGYRVAMISDLHFGVSMDMDELAGYCEQIERQQPDLVVLCGDLVDESTRLSDMRRVFALLGGIDSEYGTFYVYGNHDRATYAAAPPFTTDQLSKALEAAGVQVLQERSVALDGGLVLVGREDRSFYKAGARPGVAALMRESDPDDFLLLLDHQPQGLEENSAAGIDLQLSGHTHAGQIWPGGQIIHWFSLSDLWYGQARFGNMQAIVSSGMAGWGYPIRTSERCEYVMIDILKNT